MTETSSSAEIHPDRPHTAAIILASLFIPITMLTGQVVKLIMDSTNPSGLEDVSAGLAYLGVILGASLIVLFITVVGFLIAIAIQFRRTRTFRSIALPVTIAAIQLVIGVAAIILTRAITDIGG
ncbi:MAG: hypothetical protein ACOH17_13730 [Cellulomonas sp.]